MSDDPRATESPGRRLVHADGGKMPDEPGGSVRAALANAMVGMKKQFYGRGPTAAKAWILDDYVFVAMEGGARLVAVNENLSGEEASRKFRDTLARMTGTLDLKGMTADEYMEWLRGPRENLDVG